MNWWLIFLLVMVSISQALNTVVYIIKGDKIDILGMLMGITFWWVCAYMAGIFTLF